MKGGDTRSIKPQKSVMKNCIAEVGGWEAEMTAGASSREKEALSGRRNWMCRYEKNAKRKETQKSKL